MDEIKYELWLERYGLEYARRIAEICESEEEIASRLGIGLVFFRKWKKKHPEFAEAISLGLAESDFAVIKALHKKATGFNVGLKKSYKLKRIDFDPDTGKKIREYEELATGIEETYVPVDLSAEKFWLKNRQSDRWLENGERIDGEGEGVGGVVEIPSAAILTPHVLHTERYSLPLPSAITS